MEGLTLLQSDGQQAAEETGEGSVEKAPQARNFSSCSWITRSPTLRQLGLSHYSKASVRKCADELSWANDLIDNSASSINIPRSIDRFGLELNHYKGITHHNVHALSLLTLAYEGLRLPGEFFHACTFPTVMKNASATINGSRGSTFVGFDGIVCGIIGTLHFKKSITQHLFPYEE